MKKKSVNVFVSGHHAGKIDRSHVDQDTFLFTYRQDCQDEHAVSLTMPVVPDQYDSMGTVHPIFEMNLPEGMLREKLQSMFSKAVPDFDSLSLLEIVGVSQIGRLRYAQAGQPTVETVPSQSVADLLTYKGAENLFADLMERFAQFSGISGLQPKVLVRDAGNEGIKKIHHRSATHIVKSFTREFFELAANEHFSMMAASFAGLPTAATRLSDNRKMLVIDRFDIDDTGNYLGFEDFCVLNGMRSDGRYNSSYEDLAHKIAVYVSPEHHSNAMEQYFTMVALSCAIGNGDAHLKNFGVLYDAPGKNVRLAPVYDMLSTVSYNPRDTMALQFAGAKSFPTRAQLSRFGRQSCGLSSHQVRDVFDRIRHGLNETIKEIERYTQNNPDFKETASFFIRLFQNRQAALDNSATNNPKRKPGAHPSPKHKP